MDLMFLFVTNTFFFLYNNYMYFSFNFYEVIVDEARGQINYHILFIEIDFK